MLDIRTLIFADALLMATTTAIIFVLHRLRFTSHGVLAWLVGSACITSGLLLLGFRGFVPSVLSIVVANLMLTSGNYLLWKGFRQFLRREASPAWNLVPLAILGISLTWFTYVSPSLAFRSLACELSLAFYTAYDQQGTALKNFPILRPGPKDSGLALPWRDALLCFSGAFWCSRPAPPRVS